MSFKIAMSWPAGIGSPEVYLFIDLLKNLSIMQLRHFSCFFFFFFFFFFVSPGKREHLLEAACGVASNEYPQVETTYVFVER